MLSQNSQNQFGTKLDVESLLSMFGACVTPIPCGGLDFQTPTLFNVLKCLYHPSIPLTLGRRLAGKGAVTLFWLLPADQGTGFFGDVPVSVIRIPAVQSNSRAANSCSSKQQATAAAVVPPNTSGNTQPSGTGLFLRPHIKFDHYIY